MTTADRWGDSDSGHAEKSPGSSSLLWFGLAGLLLVVLVGGGGMFVYRARHVRQLQAMEAVRVEAEAAAQQVAALERQIRVHDSLKARCFPDHDDAQRLGNALVMDLQDPQNQLLTDAEGKRVVLAGRLGKLSESEFVIIAPHGVQVVIQTENAKITRSKIEDAIVIVCGTITAVDHGAKKITVQAAPDDCRFESAE